MENLANGSSHGSKQNNANADAVSANPAQNGNETASIWSVVHDPGDAEPHRHDATELILNLGTGSGKVTWWEQDGSARSATVHADSCCLIPAGTPHLASGLSVSGVMCLLLGGAIMAEVFRRNLSGVVVENMRRIATEDPTASGLAVDLARAMLRQSTPLLANTLGMALALRLLHSILYPYSPYDTASAPLSPSERDRALAHIQENLAGPLNVIGLARSLGLSRTHFTRRFRTTFGMPPIQYALKLRVDRALALIREGDHRVAEAAYAVGFYDQSHLDRHCRKFYGHAPSALMRM